MHAACRHALTTLALGAWTAAAGLRAAPEPAARLLVAGGGAQAEILIDPAPPRMVRLAAEELRDHLERISGARLEIVTEPTAAVPLRLYVGRSAATDALGLDAADLADGAFLRKTVADGLVLLGRDSDFAPKPPFTMQPAPTHPDTARMLAEWDALTGDTFANPFGSPSRKFNRALGVWAYDERGSLNAVHAFLADLGARWYMPGELGAILPERPDIPLPDLDRVTRPAYAMRCMTPLSTTYSSLGRDDLLWHLRLGLNAHCDALGPLPHLSHGLQDVLRRPETRAAHPEFYAVINGKRDTAGNHACLSSEALFEATLRFARALFDVYDARVVSVMPEDGFRFCQCDLCRGKDTPERGRKGLYSDYVWEFVERVARELHRTHPDRTVFCSSYGTYTLPPTRIERFSPNVRIGIVHGRGWYFPDPPIQYILRGLDRSVMDVRRDWQRRTAFPLFNWEHYPFTHLGTFEPVYFLRAIDAGIKAQADGALGEFLEVAWGPHDERGHGLHAPAFNHLNLYVTARLHWDPQLDLDTLLEEYFRLFYGPAAAEMEAFVRHCEAHWQAMRNVGAPAERAAAVAEALQRFEAARARVAPDSPHGQRLAALAGFLTPLQQLGAQLTRGRGDAPEAGARGLQPGAEADPLDGRLDKPRWSPYLAQFRTHGLVDPATGQRPELRTAFEFGWSGRGAAGTLWVGIQCEEPDLAGLPPDAEDPQDCLDGDWVELCIETQAHSFYRLVVTPSGRLLDFDHKAAPPNPHWASQADVAVHRGDGAWSVELRLPVPGADRLSDPLHEPAGRKPSADFPWFVNVSRRRVRDGQLQHWVWSPPDAAHPGTTATFGKLFVR